MATMETLAEVGFEDDGDLTIIAHRNTDSMVSVNLSDHDHLKSPQTPTFEHPTFERPEMPPPTLLDLSDDPVSSCASDSDSRPSSSSSEAQDQVREFKVPPLPSPKRTRPSRSQHVRNKSSLQEPDMAALLSRLEMENQAIAKDPKAGIAAVGAHTGPGSSFEYRVRDKVCSSLSLVTIPEEALGMSLGDFWALVTRDYHEALDTLPTVTPLMIHKGIPVFLRSAVWVGIAGAWDAALQVEFDSLCERLQHEKPQNEHIINKDLARCFPHHEHFKNPDGDGQQMLGTLLKAYALYDVETGYCQGMGFVAGALLLNMPLKDAFCVFVKLMENHGLRTLYSTTLSGLHSRTYQLSKLMSQISPDLLDHLSTLGLEMAYLSQWFMTLFATSCPLNILFRIYDVVFAEGADETVMRVALALILSNEHKLMAMKELEEVLQLLLGRRLWDPYVNEPDFLMDEIARLSNVVTPEELDKLHDQFAAQEAGESRDTTVRALGFTSGFSGLKLFGHFRTPSAVKPALRSPSTGNLLETPGHKPGHKSRRSVSKRSVATIDSSMMGNGSAADSLMSAASQASTAATECEKDRTKRLEDRGLHEQVEELVRALGEVQREAAETAEALRMENRRKESMAEIVLRLRDLVTQREQTQDSIRRDRRKTMPSQTDVDHAKTVLKSLNRKSYQISSTARLAYLQNLGSMSPDVELQDSLAKLCSLLETNSDSPVDTPRSEIASPLGLGSTGGMPGIARFADLSRSGSLHSAAIYSEASRQGSVVSLQTPQITGAAPNSELLSDDMWPEAIVYDSPSPATLVRQPRVSSLQARQDIRASQPPPPEDEAMLLELVNAKTREATALQERDEMKAQLDRFRRAQEASLAREADWARRLDDADRLMAAQRMAMQAQEDTHAAELARVRLATVQRKVRSPEVDAASLWPAGEPTTPTRLLPLPTQQQGGDAAGAWSSWFSKKGRSVSTGSAA